MNQEPKFDPLAAIYHQQAAPKMPEPLVKRLMAGIAGRVGISILGTSVVGMLTNLVQIRKVVGFVCAMIATLLGYPMKPPEEVQTRFESITQKAKAALDHTVKGESEEGEEDAPKKGKLREMVGKVAAPVKKAAHETAEKIDDAKEQAKESVEGVKDTVKSVGDKLEGKLGGGGGRRPTDAQARRAMGEALGEGDGGSLTGDAQRAVGRIGARGRAFSQGAGKAMEDARKRAEEMANQQAQQQAQQPAARCPYCKAAMHIPARSSGSYHCHGCGSSVMAGDAGRRKGGQTMKTKIAALAGVVAGIALLLIGGGGAPAWLCNVQAAFFCSLSLLYGFSAFAPNAPFWLSSRPVLGIASVYMGVVVMWVPVNILASAFFLGLGIRLLMADKPAPAGRRARTEVVANNGDIVLRESGRIATVD